jgi:hypothetical protein
MKKTLIALAALAMLAACNKAEVLESAKGDAIAFGEAFVDNATKATDPTYGAVDLTKFNVYGTVTGTAGTVNIYNGDEVTGSVGNNVWECSNEQYWIPGASYKFAAVVDANDVAQDANMMPTSLTYQTAGQKDLLYAEATATGLSVGQTNAPVNFTFSHLLSKVQFTVTSNTAHTVDYSGYYHEVKNIKVSNFTTGTYTINGGTWAGATPADIEFGNIEKITNKDTQGKTNATQMLLVPNAATFNVTFTVELYKNGTLLGTETKTIPVENDLVKGNAYNFTIACAVGAPIQFKVTNDPTWSTQPDVTIQ